MTESKFAFICGLHRSGTSLVFKCLRDHPEISGFANTGVPEDEGQHLQSVVPTAKSYGGPGRFGYAQQAYLDETSELATPETAATILEDWSPYWDMDKAVLLEKSPPNLIRTRFLQQLFPNSYFIIITRHPIAVSYATKKWKKISVSGLIQHWLFCHEAFLKDQPFLEKSIMIRYEDFVQKPDQILEDIYTFLALEPAPRHQTVRTDINGKYFQPWYMTQQSLVKRPYYRQILRRYEARVNRFGYSLAKPEATLP